MSGFDYVNGFQYVYIGNYFGIMGGGKLFVQLYFNICYLLLLVVRFENCQVGVCCCVGQWIVYKSWFMYKVTGFIVIDGFCNFVCGECGGKGYCVVG